MENANKTPDEQSSNVVPLTPGIEKAKEIFGDNPTPQQVGHVERSLEVPTDSDSARRSMAIAETDGNTQVSTTPREMQDKQDDPQMDEAMNNVNEAGRRAVSQLFPDAMKLGQEGSDLTPPEDLPPAA